MQLPSTVKRQVGEIPGESSRREAVKKRKEKIIQEYRCRVQQSPKMVNMLIHERILNPCSTHSSYTKNEKTEFCLECCSSFCPYCIHEPNHHCLQIRRCKGDELVEVADMEKLIDCSFIQSYSVNRALVLYMKERTQSKAMQAFSNFCDCGHLHTELSFVQNGVKACVFVIANSSLCFLDLVCSAIITRKTEPEDPQKKRDRRKGIPVQPPCQ